MLFRQNYSSFIIETDRTGKADPFATEVTEDTEEGRGFWLKALLCAPCVL